jgi:Tol biopolymer transport system component/tRNA A-37 threonylcarbamoyl transferase component Bud32
LTGKSEGKIGLKSPPPADSGLSPESIREQVQKVVASRTFSQSKKLVRFLSFIVEKALLGQGEQVNEYLIGVEVYERPASFDPQIDTIVRGEARRLRSKLRQYFDAQGLHDPIVIDVPKGAYVAVFRERDRGVLDRKAGQLISRYRLSEKLGEGGMGAVYLAEDTVLGRSVALKFLSESLLRDKDRRARLVREARAAAAIDHPNVGTVYEIDEVEGQPFIAMAFIKGRNLKDRIPEGPLEFREALNIACQLAEGLQAAHQQGVIHRDLKPANVIITSGSHGARVKIIDFGLAQLSAATRLTAVSTPIGTDSYVSPEQMNGEVVDHRSDLWSLGIILYEMVTGKLPFRGERREAVFYAIAHLAPEPMSRLRAGVPEELERIVSKCLEKDPARRYADAAALKADLSHLLHSLPDSGQVSPLPLPAAPRETSRLQKQPRRWVAFAAAAVLVVVAGAVGLMWLLQKKDVVRQPAEMKRLTFDSGLAVHPSISPDGKYVAFASDRAGERNLDIWVQELPGGEPVRLTRDVANEDFPSFSPDGARIAFQSERDGGIYSIPVLGGEPRSLAQKGTQPHYSPDGQQLLFTVPDTAYGQPGLTTAVFLMPAEGGAVTEFRTGFSSSSNPVWSPDANRLLYAGSNLSSASEVIRFQLNGVALGGAAWYIAPVSEGKLVHIEPSAQFARLLPAFSLPLAWLRSNRILFSYASSDAVNLWVATLSPDNRRIIGAPEQLTFGLGRITDASVADSGAVVFASTAARPRLWDIPLDGRETSDKGDPMAAVTNRDFAYWPSLSDTGKLAYLARTSEKFNLWLRDLRSGKEALLASVESDGNINRVSAYINRTGTQLAYTTWHGSKQVIYGIGAGGGIPEKICEDCGQLRSWSPDGKVMLSQERLFEGSKLVAVRINRIDVMSGHKTVLLEKGFLFSPELSPDGHWVAFQARGSLASRREQLFLAPMSDGAAVEPERWVPITELKYFDANPLFSRDGKILYFNSDRDGFTCLWAVRLDLATGKPVGAPYPVKHFHGNPRHYSWYPAFCVGPDRIIISLEQVQSDLWMTQLPEGR